MSKVRSQLSLGDQSMRVRLHAPVGNIVDEGMLDDLCAALLLANRTPSLKLILLCAEGPDFSLGSVANRACAEKFHHLLRLLLDLSIPSAAVVSGRCLDRGFLLAAACHFLFTESRAQLGYPQGRG